MRSDKMRKFLAKLMIFILPLLITGSIIIGIAWHLGDAMPLHRIVDMQQADPRIMYRTETRNGIFHHKLLSINARQSAIMILGSSRVEEFPDNLTQNADDYYNMSIPDMDLQESLWILQQISNDAMPEIIILNVDPMHFNIAQCDEEDFTLPDLPSDFEQIIIGTRNLWQDILLEDVKIDELFYNMQLPNSARIRLGSKVLVSENNGYSATGSRLLEYVRLVGLENSRTKAREALTARSDVYISGNELCMASFEMIEQFLQLSEEYGVTTIGVVLPFTPDVYEAFMSESDFAYFPKSLSRFEQIFAKYDGRFYDFSDPSIFDADYTYFRDGHHPGPVLSAKVFYAIAQANSELFAPYVNLDELDQLIVSARHPYALSKDVKIFGDSAEITKQINLAKQLINENEPEQAITLLTQILEPNSSDVRVLVNRSRAYIKLNQLDEALHDINRAIFLNSNHSYAHHIRAQIYYLQGDIESSIVDYNHELELGFINFDTYGKIGLLYLESGDVSNAISSLETYIENADGNPAPRYSKALESARQLVNQNE
jgi:tetratricopeptide (TPR) repeat protein